MAILLRVVALGVLCALLACDDEPAAPAPSAPSDESATEASGPAAEPPEPVSLEEPEAQGPPPPEVPTMAERSGLHLTRLFTTPGLDGPEPGEPGEPRQVYSKSADEKVYCYFVLANPEETETRLTLSWVDAEGETANEPSIIEVPAQSHFASYRYTNIAHRTVGDYACLIQNDGRAQLGRAPIRVEE